MEKYYLLRCDEDGDHYLKKYTKKEIEEMLRLKVRDEEKVDFASELPEDLNQFCGEIIIKGEIIVPKIDEVVVRYKI
jgi:hypothetical protein